MKYVSFMVGLFLLSTIISQTSLSLGLTSSTHLIYIPENDLGGDGFWESLAGGINFVWNNISVMWQFLTLRTELPAIISLFLVTPFILAVAIMIMLIIRGVGS